MKVSVLGCGRWGSCIAWYLDKTGHEVLSCGLSDAPEFIQLKTTRKNDYLSFPESIEVSDDLEYAVNRAEVIIISISSQYLRSYFEDISKYNLDGKIIVLCMKGVEVTTGKRLSQVVGDFVDTNKTPVAVWVGPGHPQDYVKGIPNCMVIDSDNQEVKEKLVSEFTSELIRFYLGTDLIGSEIGAAAKNVIGIAAGMLDGLGYTSLKGALMARGTREIARLIKVGQEHTYPMIAFGTLKKRSAFKLYAKAEGIDFSLANAISEQIGNYDEAMKKADDEERENIDLFDYVDREYEEYIEKSKEYWGIISDKKKAPSAYLLYQGNIRREIGLIKCKSESTKKEYITCVIDGAVAENYKFLKND